MQQIQIAKRQINYQHTIKLTYNIKITKTTYTNRQNKKTYTRYKIRIPEELQQKTNTTQTKTTEHQKKYLKNFCTPSKLETNKQLNKKQ